MEEPELPEEESEGLETSGELTSESGTAEDTEDTEPEAEE